MTDPAEPGPDPLLALFRAEAAAAAAALTGGLAVLAVDADHPADWEGLERAARSVRGAALIVAHADAAELAGAVGDALADARRDRATVTPERVAALLSAVDVLTGLADAAGADGRPPSVEQVAEVLGRLRAVGAALRGGPPPDATTDIPLEPPAPRGDEPRGSLPPSPADDPHTATLLELFREEVRSLCDALGAGLVELEAGAADPRRIEPLMRAAHSIKGAARIVAVEPAVNVAHVMEELLVAAQHGQAALGPAAIDALLAGVDLLARMADADLAAWARANAGRAAECAATLRALLNGEPAPVRSPPPVEPPPPPPAPLVAAAPPEPAEASAVARRPSSPDDGERVVRVSAHSLSRLLSLAGESLVEARWLQPFARSLLKLRKYQDHLADVLDELHAAVAADPGRAGPVAADARRRLDECRELLADRIAVFESHARESDDLNSRLYQEVIASRMRPFADATHGLGRMVRDVARQLGKKVRLDLAGQDTDVDRDILDKLEAPLGHIIRNAIDHGIEPPEERTAAGKPEVGTVRVEARHHAGTLAITVSDDGRGIDPDRLRRKVVERQLTTADMAARMSEPELLDFLFLPGFSTAPEVTDVSGRGVGLDVVQSTAQAVGGGVRVHSRAGRGTTFELQLPITLSVVRAVLVRISGDPYAFPLNRTDRLLRLPPDKVRTLEGKPHFEADGRHVGLVPAHLVFDLPPGEPLGDELSVVLIADRFHQYGLAVEGFMGEQDLVVRPLDRRLGKVPNVAAAAILEDGSPVLIVDVDDVTRSVGMLIHEGKLRHQRPAKPGKRRRKRVLVVDDSAIVREVERQMLQGRGYEVDVAVDGADGWNAARSGSYDLVVSDIDMPRMTGLEFVRAIRADAKVQSLPVVIVSYKERAEDRVRGLEAGANYYLTKSSFHDGRFLQAVEELIGGPEE